MAARSVCVVEQRAEISARFIRASLPKLSSGIAGVSDPAAREGIGVFDFAVRGRLEVLLF